MPSALLTRLHARQGAYGCVHIGFRQGKRVAVKVISLPPDSQARLALKRELELARRALPHPTPYRTVRPTHTPVRGCQCWCSCECCSCCVLQMRECAACDNVVAYRDSFFEHEEPKRLWIVMEFCEMGSALDMMRRRESPLEESTIAWICRGVLCALNYMHTMLRTAIHRDIKAANILVTSNGVVKVADFGVSAQLWEAS